MIRISAASDSEYALFPFYRDGQALDDAHFPHWGLTMRKAGSMRFRWNETNERRNRMLDEIASSGSCSEKSAVPVSLELIHSKIVYDIRSEKDTEQKLGDGMITADAGLMPVVTVADCMPLYLYDEITGVFGVVHSGWKGTGIIEEAVKLAQLKYGARPENVCVAIGPHIKSCCYIVNQERAEYFASNFTPDCVELICTEELSGSSMAAWNNGDGPLYRLSLEKANLFVLERAGIRSENTVIAEDCTCCNPVFGSNRRETLESDSFTVQAAFVRAV